MPSKQPLASRIYMKVSGSEVQEAVINKVLQVTVDQHTHLPHMFTIRLADPDQALIDGGPFDLTKEVEIEVADPNGTKVKLIKGEITALEPTFGEGMISECVVRGYDKSHRLYREVKSVSHLNKKDSDLANQIASSGGLGGGTVDSTSTVYEHVYQHNQSDLAFLMQRAWRIGYECFVEDGKLYFRKPPTSGAIPELTWGQDLQTFHPRMTLAEQVSEVLVKGWDSQTMKAIVGKASSGALYPSIGESKNGADWSATFGTGKLVVVDQPVADQAEADTLAAARLNELSGSFIQAEGVALRRPDIRAGKMVKIAALGERFSGDYLVTSATHVYKADGFTTQFAVRGSRTGLLTEQMLQQPPLDRWPGIVLAVVTNNQDPEKLGRVKVKFPWMADDQESNWARVISAGAGPKAGFFAIPGVNDEVAVAFEHGDFDRPYVLGGLWNGKHALPDEGDAAQDKAMVREWRSRDGHYIVLNDEKKKIEIITTGGHKVVIDDQNKKIEVSSSGGHSVAMDDQGRKVAVKSAGDLEAEAKTNVKVKGLAITIEATGNLDLKANGMVNIKGAMVNIN
jgi:phage protein D